MKTGLFIKMLELNNYNKTDFYIYQQLIKKLIYLICKTRLDIVFAIRQFNRQNADSRNRHLKVVKKVVRYLKGTMQIGLIFRQKSQLTYGLTSYTNSNFAKDLKD